MSEREAAKAAELIAGRFFDDGTFSLVQMKPFTLSDGSTMMNGGAHWVFGSFVREVSLVLQSVPNPSTER
jgi:hypothetical protein